MFNLDKKNNKSLVNLINKTNTKEFDYKKKKYTKDEIKDMLKNFKKIESEDWPTIKKGSYIRYYRNDGNFRRGGYVVNNYYDKNNNNRIIRLICQYGSPPIPDKNPTWFIKYSDLKFIWVKELHNNIPNINIINDLKNSNNNINNELIYIKNEFNTIKTDILNIKTDILNIKKDITNIIKHISK